MRPLFLAPLALVAAPALAQEAATLPDSDPTSVKEEGEDEDEELIQQDNEILVVATRIRGQVDAPQPPLLTLDAEDIASYGAASISELLTSLAPQTGSGRGRGEGGPVMLLNGQRISSFREMRNIPPEAIRKMEILPEEVALRFGYSANQRVVNIILKDQFSSKTVAAEYGIPTRGGFSESELEASLFRISGKNRINVTAKLEDTSMLTEAERHVLQTDEGFPVVAGDPDPAKFRSLIDDSRDLSLNATWARGLGEGANSAGLSVNGALTRSDSRSLNGLDAVVLTAPDGDSALRYLDDPLLRTSRTTKFETGLAFNKPISGWQLTVTADASHTDTDSRIDRRAGSDVLRPLIDAAADGTLAIDGALPRFGGVGYDLAENKSLGFSSLATLAGRPMRLPGGEVALTAKAGYAFTRSVNRDTRTTGGDTRFKRGDVSAGVNIGVPISSRREGFLSDIGDLALNLSAGIDHLSDFGTLSDWSAGFSWSPTEKLSFQVSYMANEAAPSLSQLGSPEILSYNVTVFDFTRGESALVTTIGGGNPDLLRETQNDLKIGANWQLPMFKNNSNLIVEYFRNSSDDVTQSFPLLTPAIEAAFPDRVFRDADGRLVSIDRRPVTFDKIKSSRLRWGFNVFGQVGKPDPNARRDSGGGGPRMGRGGGGGGPRGMGRGPMGGRGDGRGRWNVSLYHTYRIDETVQVAPGSPVLDLLGGDAIASGGVARHAFEMEGGVFHKGFGVRLRGKWSAPTHVVSSGAPGSSDLRFGSVLDIGGRIFVNFDQKKSLVEKVPFLKGARLAFEFDNILDSRQRVTDGAGNVPLTYQAAYRDPRGRVIGIDFRKMF